MSLTKGINYFPGKTAVDVEVRYYLHHNATGTEHKVTERHAARVIRDSRTMPELADMFTVVRDVREWTAPACMYCGSRPSEWEWDCDGRYDTRVCASEQCRSGRFGE